MMEKKSLFVFLCVSSKLILNRINLGYRYGILSFEMSAQIHQKRAQVIKPLMMGNVQSFAPVLGVYLCHVMTFQLS